MTPGDLSSSRGYALKLFATGLQQPMQRMPGNLETTFFPRGEKKRPWPPDEQEDDNER